jgi:predicted protein tyrosine phosphatase
MDPRKRLEIRKQLEPHGVLVLSLPQVLCTRPVKSTRLISISSPGSSPLPPEVTERYSSTLVLQFYDEREIDGGSPFTIEQARSLYDYLHTNAHTRYVIHCHAGISRSAAVALCVAVVRNDSPLFFEILTNDTFSPNTTVFRLFLQAYYEATESTPCITQWRPSPRAQRRKK